jgi:hypothetical protein
MRTLREEGGGVRPVCDNCGCIDDENPILRRARFRRRTGHALETEITTSPKV